MNKKRTVQEIKQDLKDLDKYKVVVFGGYCTSYFNQRSDIDIAIITQEQDPQKNRTILFDLFAFQKPPYEFHVFELLPLHVKIEVIKNHSMIFGNETNLAEYFYHFRKLWKDQEPRYKQNLLYSMSQKVGMVNEK